MGASKLKFDVSSCHLGKQCRERSAFLFSVCEWNLLKYSRNSLKMYFLVEQNVLIGQYSPNHSRFVYLAGATTPKFARCQQGYDCFIHDQLQNTKSRSFVHFYFFLDSLLFSCMSAQPKVPLSSDYLVGVVGTSRSNTISKDGARIALVEAMTELRERVAQDRKIVIISGGGLVPMLAFDYAREKHWKAIQVVCPKVKCRPQRVKRIEIGKKHGDESTSFIEMIHGIIRIGGGPQSHREVQAFVEKKGELTDANVIEKYVDLLPSFR